jgi:hypothetical protein
VNSSSPAQLSKPCVPATVPGAGPGDGSGAPPTAVADSLILRACEAFAMGGDSEDAATLTSVLGALDRAVKSGRTTLEARGPRSKAEPKAAADVRAAYDTAARAVRPDGLSPVEHAPSLRTRSESACSAGAVRERLRAAVSAWRRAARAARADEAAAFDGAERPSRTAEHDLAAAIDRLAYAWHTLGR